MPHRSNRHRERHVGDRIGWLRAAVLGANDGVLSTASLIIGVASAAASPQQILLTGLAGLVAGSMSMAAGEYVSVSSQADAEKADLAKEAEELSLDAAAETRELAAIYQRRGLDPDLAHRVAVQLMEADALGAHARDELGYSDVAAARPVQAALASAGSFATGALLPVLAAVAVPAPYIAAAVTAVSLLLLIVLGVIGAQAGGAPPFKAAVRVLFWGALAMAVTALVGKLAGATL